MTQRYLKRIIALLAGCLLAAFLSACDLPVAAFPTPSQPADTPVTAPVPKEAALPDLVISNVRVAMQGLPDDPVGCVAAYAPYELRAMIENRGSVQANNIQVLEGATGYAMQIGELPAGQSMEVFVPALAAQGVYHLSVDPQNQIAESDEGNNTLDYLAGAPTPPALCTPPESGQGEITPLPGQAGSWNTYQDARYGFSFEYPLAYEAPVYREACGLKTNPDGLGLGQRIELQVFDAGGVSLADFANNLAQSKGWSVDAQISETIGGQDGLQIQYRFGGANRFGSLSLVEHNGRIIAVGFTAGVFCEIPGDPITEPDVYAHMIESFRFIP